MVSGDTESGPIPVTVKVAGACKIGWDVVGVLALSNDWPRSGIFLRRGRV